MLVLELSSEPSGTSLGAAPLLRLQLLGKGRGHFSSLTTGSEFM